MSSKRSSSNSSAGGPSSKKPSSSGSSGSSVEPVFAESTFNEVTYVYTYCGGWVDIDDRIKKSIKTIVIEEGVTEIVDANGGIGLFGHCTNLTSITFPQTGNFVKIGSYALFGCRSLATLAVPDSFVDIEEFALWGCYSLKSFTFPNKCTMLSRFVLTDCLFLTILIIPDGCVEIQVRSLWNCVYLTSLAIPNACTQVRRAFTGCTALEALADKSNLTIVEYCRKQWRSPRLFAFKVNLFASYNILNRIRLSDPLLNDPLIDKTSILWVMYDRITSDDVRRLIMEFLDYKWMGNR